MISFFVQGTPKPQPRPRVFQDAKCGKYRAANPVSSDGWKSLVTFAAKRRMCENDPRNDFPLTGPLSVTLEFLFPRPDCHWTYGNVGRSIKLTAPDHVTGKPLGDIDNLAKAVLDALTRCRMWNDDCQVAMLTASKKYHDQPEGGCLVKIEEL